MNRPRIRRLLLHPLLAVATTPLPGWAVVGVRAVQAGRLSLGLAAGATGLLLTGLGLGLTVTLPCEVRRSAATVLLLWFASGIAAAIVEHRYQLQPEDPDGDGVPALRERLALWPVAVAITWLPAAFMITMVTTRWGAEILQKPSFPREVLWVCALVLAPIGLVIAVGRALLRRPFSIGAPLAFAVALPAGTLAVAFGELGYEALRKEAFELAALVAMPPPQYPRTLNASQFAWVVVFIALTAYIADARGVGRFLARSAALIGLTFLASTNEAALDGSLPVAIRRERAVRLAAAGDDAAAARGWRWLSRYAPLSSGAPKFLEAGTIAALRAGDRELARELLSRVPALAHDVPVTQLKSIAEAMLTTTLDPQAIAVNPTLVLPERYLSNEWCAALSAVRAALPELSESRLKRQLQPLSRAADSLDLAPIEQFDDLRVLARTLGLEAWAIPFDRLGDVLRSGLPALALDPIDGQWRLIYRLLPEAGALEFIDYAKWSREARPLDEEDTARLVAAEDHGAERLRRIAVETRGLGAIDWARDRQALDGGWLFVVAPSATPPAGADLAAADHLTHLAQGRKALLNWAPTEALRYAGRLPPGPERSELEELSGQMSQIDARVNGALYPTVLGHSPTLAGGRPFSVDGKTPFGLHRLCKWTRLLDAPCAERARLLERLHALDPTDLALSTAMLDYLIKVGDLRGAARVGHDLARDQGFEDPALLTVLVRLAPAAGDDPDARRVLAELISHLQLMVAAAKEEAPILARFSAAVAAGRAALATDSAAAVAGWRRAAELDPDRASYRGALARALTAAGAATEAAAAHQQEVLLAGTPICAATLPKCKG